MFDIGWTEIAIIVVVAVIVIGPTDMPRVLRVCGQMIGKAKALTREFRGHIDDIIRESELDEVKRQIDGKDDARRGRRVGPVSPLPLIPLLDLREDHRDSVALDGAFTGNDADRVPAQVDF